MSQIQYKTITMVAFVMLLLLFNPPVYGAVPDYIILDHSNSNGAITGTAGPLTQKVGYANTDVSITNTKSFWTTIKLPPENSTFTLTPTNIYYSFGLIGPNKTATYKLDFYKESMANLGVDPTLESGAGASIMNIVQILLTGLQADFIMDEMFDLSDWLMEAYQIEALNEAANLFLSRKPVNAAWTLANTVYQKDILSKILQLLQKVGYTGNISNLEDKIQVFGIYSIMKQVGDQAWTYLFENPSGYVYFDAKKSNAGEIDPYIVCNFSATPQNAPVNTPITFDASQSIAYKDTIVSYKWNFGDGTTTETTSPSTTHSYKTTGYYYTGLTIKSAIGKGQTGGQSITIGDVTTGGRYFAGGTLTESTTWAVENSPILIAGSLTIPDGVSLTIQNGVQVILNNGVSISVSGTLKATGVKFTAQDQAGSWWAGITFDGAGSKDSRLENCVLECVPYYYVYGHCGVISVKDSSPTIKGCTIDKCSTYYGILINNGSPVIQGNTINGFKESGIYVDGTSSPAITGNTISNNEYGIYVSYSANNPIFSGNSYSDNAKGDLTVEGTIQGAVSWDETSDAVYNIKRLNIPQGSSLTIASGRTLKINPGISIPVSGTLKATGVKFTAQDQAGSWWAGITFDGAGSKDSRLENCVLECVPYYYVYGHCGVISVKDSSPTIKGCTIDKCSTYYGILINNGSPVIQGNTINGINGYGIWVDGPTSPVVTGNTITNNQYGIYVNGGGTYQRNTIKGNSSYGLYYFGTSIIDATNCDWGDPSGPLDDSDDRATGGLYNPNGKGNKVSDHVNYNPWGISEQLALSVSPVSRSVAKAAGTTTFSVANTGTGTMPWTAAVTSGGSWLSITTGSSGSNSGTISCSFTANAGISVRTASIRVTATGATNSPQDVTVTQVVSSAGSLAASFAGSGLWVYNSDSATWTQISSINPENMIYSGSTLYADFGALGLWMWDGAAWSQLTSADPENMVTAGSTLYVDFGASYGLYKWDGDSWTHLTQAGPENMVTAGSTLYVDFGASYGLYKWDGDSWAQLTPADPENMVTGGSALYVDFGISYGLYKWDGASWSQLTSADPENMVTSDSSLFVDFGASYGLYKWDGASWSQLTSANPENMVTAVSTLYVDFGASYGLYKWDGAAWSQLTSSDPENIVTLGSMLYGDFGASGFWKWDGSSWSQITGFNPLKIVVSN